ncbi:hypothetical protein [Kitasatospora sp. KL5]|uniref:hypothetical protein n=1 Tax=Kitasatospora sp. KL5 TaxID=3425125 RepID=UPI003D6F17A5
MNHGEGGDAVTVWEFDTAQVRQIWLDTREVFGNKLWVEGMLYGVFPEEWQQEAELRSGLDFFDVLVSAVEDSSPGDPSEVFLAFRREFAKYGIETVFAPHPDHGDVLERARKLEAGEPLPEPGPWHLGEDAVTGIWDTLADGFDDCAGEVAEWLPEQLVDELETACGERAFIAVGWALDKLAPDDDRSLAFVGLQRLAAEYGIELAFAPHPRFGDLIRRAEQLAAGEAVAGPGPFHLDEATVVELWRRLTDPGGDPASELDEALPDTLLEAIEEVTGQSSYDVLLAVTDDLDEDDDPSLFLAALQRSCARRGLLVSLAPHPLHGDATAPGA